MIDDERAAQLLLLTMPGMGPARLRWATQERSAVAVVGTLRRGSTLLAPGRAPSGVNADLVASWAAHVRSIEGPELLDAHRTAGITVLAPGDQVWPFDDDPEPPALIFARGNADLLVSGQRVGIVGTRRCSSVGRRVARQMGASLADSGISVVSGLALGIDGATHEGVLEASRSRNGVQGCPIGVVATGLDVSYPKKHERLWEQIGEQGVLISEAPLGTSAQKWRFPARNRLIAALSCVVVVVESHSRGGALSTVEEAISRSVDVVAVPGSVLSAASEGTNALLFDGCAPVRGAQDVLDLLGTTASRPGVSAPLDTQRGLPFATAPNVDQPEDALQRKILSEVSAQGLHLDGLIASTGEPFSAVAAAIHQLENSGWVSVEGSTVSLSPKDVAGRSR